jgi:hypothetical protein
VIPNKKKVGKPYAIVAKVKNPFIFIHGIPCTCTKAQRGQVFVLENP